MSETKTTTSIAKKLWAEVILWELEADCPDIRIQEIINNSIEEAYKLGWHEALAAYEEAKPHA